MFNMGMISNFTSQDSKDTTGKNYNAEFALEIKEFLMKIDKFGGVIGLIDLYCIYNRVRIIDMISPDDFNLACTKLN